MSSLSRPLDSVCVYCGSSNGADLEYLAAATRFGAILAGEQGAHDAGGRVLGVIPEFLTSHEKPLSTVRTVVVHTMHERKMMMYEAADAFAILPGAIGTLEEVIELLSWRRLGLHVKPIVFYNPDGFWNSLFELFNQIIASKLLPAEFNEVWRAVETVQDILPAIREMPALAFAAPPGLEELI